MSHYTCGWIIKHPEGWIYGDTFRRNRTEAIRTFMEYRPFEKWRDWRVGGYRCVKAVATEEDWRW